MQSLSRALIILVPFVASILAACSQAPVARPTPAMSLPPGDRGVLAGEWEYEDGAVVKLTLDEQGHGTYAWKDGRFETTSLTGHVWQGLWLQKENDREGGFVVELSPDYSEGEGRWWYTRIGSNRAPTEKGGTFHLSRKPSISQAQYGPTAP
jgi:hypothetical protein